MKDRISGIGIGFVYIGTIIGAGFASGQELYQFFARFGFAGLIGISISGVLFSVIGYFVLRSSSVSKDIDTEKMILPFRSSYFDTALKIILGFFLFGVIVVMLAGSGALLKETFGINPWAGSTVMMVLCFITVLSGKSGIMKSFKAAVPFLIFGMLAVVIFSLKNPDMSMAYEPIKTKGSWVVSAVLFMSYNMIAAISVLVPLGKEINTKADALKGALTGGLTLGAIGFLVTYAIIINGSQLKGIEVPIVHLASLMSVKTGRAYSVFLLAAIFTTAIGCMFALEEKYPKAMRFDKRIASLIVLSAALFLSNIGFSKLIGIIYPVSGYVGIVLLAGVFCFMFRNRRKKPRLSNALLRDKK